MENSMNAKTLTEVVDWIRSGRCDPTTFIEDKRCIVQCARNEDNQDQRLKQARLLPNWTVKKSWGAKILPKILWLCPNFMHHSGWVFFSSGENENGRWSIWHNNPHNINWPLVSWVFFLKIKLRTINCSQKAHVRGYRTMRRWWFVPWDRWTKFLTGCKCMSRYSRSQPDASTEINQMELIVGISNLITMITQK